MIEGFRLGIDYMPDWFMNRVTQNEIILHGKSSGFKHYDDTNCDILTSNGTIHANHGDYIIKVGNQIYAIEKEIFEEHYTKVS